MPKERSTGGKQRFGKISKAGNDGPFTHDSFLQERTAFLKKSSKKLLDVFTMRLPAAA